MGEKVKSKVKKIFEGKWYRGGKKKRGKKLWKDVSFVSSLNKTFYYMPTKYQHFKRKLYHGQCVITHKKKPSPCI